MDGTMKWLAMLLVALGLAGCAGVHQLQAAPPGLHPENAPTPSGKVLNQ